MIKPIFIAITAGLLPAAAQVTAFPGAEGFGAYATGGRGGDVYIVTNLNSTGAGSFYNGLTTIPANGRTIIFAVSGQIRLASGVGTRITSNKLTIAGHTAPGDGILLKDGTLRISSDDVIIRHLRFRHGKYGSGGDCIDLDSGCKNAILDHISMSFSTDENISSFSSPPENITMQWALNAWGLEPHSCGGLWDQNHATCHHSLWAHNHTRNPKARPAGLLEWTNNVTFDWDIGFIMGDSETPAGWKSNVRGNYFICPPGNIRNTPLEKASLDRNGYPNFSVYLDNNLHDRDGNGSLNGTDRGYSIVAGTAYDATTNPTGNYIKLPTPVSGSARLTVDSPLLAYKKIVSNGGALRLDAGYAGTLRDEVDTRLIQNLVNQTANHITRESDLAGVSNGGFGTFASSPAPIDSDKDGMPDPYETALGWNPALQDHNTTLANAGGVVTGPTFMPSGTVAGHTRLEEYLHFKSIPHLIMQKATDTGTVDLTRFTQGFSNNPIFTLSNVTGGTITQSGTGGRMVKFTSSNLAGRGGFLFTVTDADGSVWTQQFAICVSSSSAPVDLSWRGSGSVWDTTSQNWLKGSAPSLFSGGDRVSFYSSGSVAPTVNIPGSVFASTVDVDSSTNYTFSGAGSIGTTYALSKRGTGTLTLSNTSANSFNDVLLEDGTLRVTATGALGSAKVICAGGTLSLGPPSNAVMAASLQILAPTTITPTTQHELSGVWNGANQTVTLSGGNSLWTIGGSWTAFSGRIQMGNGSTRIRLNGNSNNNFGSSAVAVDLGSNNAEFMNRNGSATTPFDIGSLESTGSATRLGGTQTGSVVSTYRIGALNTNTSFAGGISNGGSAITHINKTGTGSWTLTGTSTHGGTTTVSQGALWMNGDFSSSPVTANAGSMLGGVGNFGALVTASSGSSISPGASSGVVGTLKANAGMTFTGSSTVALDLSDSPTTGNDQITVAGGNLTLSGATVTFNVNPINGVLASGTYRLISGAAVMAANPAPNLILGGLPSGSRQTFGLSRSSSGATPAFVDLTISGNAPASLVWGGGNAGGLWNLNSTGNFTGGPTSTFFNLDAITFNDTSTVGNVVLNGVLQPRSVTVANSSRAYVWTGSGMIDGKTSLVKTGTGTLTITPAMVTLSSTTVSGSNQITVTDAASLGLGMAVNGGGFPYGSTITAISGNVLTVSATTAASATVSISYHARNRFSGGTSIGPSSTIQLGNEAGNRWGLGTGAVTFNGGTLKMHDAPSNAESGDLSNALIVPAGQTGTLHTCSRGTLSGSLTGSGVLNLVVKYVRGDFYGNWSGFSGQINVTAATGSEFRMAESYGPDGFPNASIHLGAGITMKHTGVLSQGSGTTIEIGELSGVSSSTLRGGVTGGRALTYVVGRKGSSGVNVTFSGAIREQTEGSTLTNIVKIGPGTWTLAGVSSWAGGCSVNAGALAVTGSVTSIGAVSVADGAGLILTGGAIATDSIQIPVGAKFSGHGSVVADLNCQGTFEGRGFASETPGTLAVTGSAFFDGALFRLKGGKSSDRVAVSGDLSLAGTVQISLSAATGFGRYPLFTSGGSLTVEDVTLTGIPVGTTAHLSTRVAGQVDLVIDDSDEDGLPDSWENQYLGNLNSGPDADPDGDGQKNSIEFLTGTHPSNGASRFAATMARSGAGQFRLTWPSVPGRIYQIESSQTLSGGWLQSSSIPGATAPATTTSHLVTPTGSTRFYRVGVSP